ncbi:hypothetical protein BDW42DRAFT_201207 [Aspergillus taichungensis]|uniref:Zn(2)-C6 fungal-type domain-containing protein n=1 Tax=Aspergillus taichungensis TaxID=482145 RepID=A0A2J5HU13_9EURO|nr:hypothetical protein BDW42DRAFT_201207 [Aspergillus taichungensis]
MTPLKRRRLDVTPSTLSKPFKSPLRRPPATSETAAPHTPTKHEEHLPSTTTPRAQSTPDTFPSSHTTTPTATSTPASISKRKRTSLLPADPTLLHLQKQQRSLQAHLFSLRSDLDTAQQALRLESSTQDAELEGLVAKWRGVAQSAAEEVFEGARERVARMGGMKAWRERMREDRMGGWGEGEEEQKRGAGEEGDDYGGTLERHRGRGIEEKESETRDGDDGDDEEEFTMDVMLKTLNVDLKAIGFDPVQQRRCDHAKPMCGECRRRGTECLPMKSRKDGQDITIPLEYLKQLESRIAELDRPPAATHDAGVQTDFPNQLPGPHTAALSDVADSGPGGLHPAGQQMFGTSDDYSQNDLLRHVAASEQDLMRGSDMRAHVPRLEGALISRLAYEVYPGRPGWDFYAGTDVESPHAGYPVWQEEVYANLYFSITHWVWPFLDSGAWRTWRQEWNSDSEADQWKGFLVKMVLAIGALSCNVLQPSQGHSAHAADLYTAAMAYYPYVMGHESAILQIQASILMVLYALQCPSAEEISTAVSSIVPFCTATVADLRKHAASGNGDDQGHAGGPGEVLTETLFITCFMLNEIVVSGWDRPVSASYRAIDDDVYSLRNEVPSSSSTSTALRHLFRLRKIQADIRRQWREESGQPRPNDTMLKSALDTWRNEIPRYGVEEAPSTRNGTLFNPGTSRTSCPPATRCVGTSDDCRRKDR